MAINVSNLQNNGGFLLDIYTVPSGNPIKCHEEVLSSQPNICSQFNVLTVFPPDWVILRRSRCVPIFLGKQTKTGPGIRYPSHLTVKVGGRMHSVTKSKAPKQ